MDRYDPPEPPSIFSRPADEIDEASPWSPPESPSSRPPRAGGDPSRRLIIAVGAGGILLIGLIGYVGASVLRTIDDPTLTASSATAPPSAEPSPTPSASASPTPSPTPSPSVGPTPTLRPQPATPLLAGRWATVLTDLVQIRDAPGLGSAVVGAAGRGEIVFILASDPPVDADGLTWYAAVSDPNELGWVAGHGETEQLLRSDAPSATVVWCGIPTAPVFSMNDQTLGDQAVVAGLPVSTDTLGRPASSAIELMWGAQLPVCLALTIDDGSISAAAVDVRESFCAKPMFGASATALVVPDGPGPLLETGRDFNLDDSVLGTYYADGELANIEDVITVAGTGPADLPLVCVDINARGGGDDTTIVTSLTTDACVVITDIGESAVTLADLEQRIWTVELERFAGSVVAPSLTTGVAGVRLSAQMGPEGAFSLQPSAILDC